MNTNCNRDPSFGSGSGSASGSGSCSCSGSGTSTSTGTGTDWALRPTMERGYLAEMAEDAVFRTFSEPRAQNRVETNVDCDSEQFIRKQYPMLYMNLRAQEHPFVRDVQYVNERDKCALCGLDKNTLDSIKVLKPEEVKAYLASYQHDFTEEQVNMHLGHTVKDQDLIGVIRNMSVDLISKSYSLAHKSSLYIMNSVRTHLGRTIFVPDQEMAKIHSDSIKQFIGLAATYQALLKHKRGDCEKAPQDSMLL